MQPKLSVILDEVNREQDKDKKVALLQRYDCAALRKVFELVYDPDIKFLLPSGAIEYRKNSYPDLNILHNLLKKMYLYIEGGNPNLTEEKRVKLFRTNILEQIDAQDAELMMLVKDKKLPYETINLKLIRKAYPGFLNEKVRVKANEQES